MPVPVTVLGEEVQFTRLVVAYLHLMTSQARPRARLEHPGVAALGLTLDLTICRRSLHSQHPQGRHRSARPGGQQGGDPVLLGGETQQAEHQVAGGQVALRETQDLRQVLPENPGQLPGFG